MRMKTAAARNDILIDHAQRAEAHVMRIAIIAERKTVPGIEPVDLGGAAFVGFAQCQHKGLVSVSNIETRRRTKKLPCIHPLLYRIPHECGHIRSAEAFHFPDARW